MCQQVKAPIFFAQTDLEWRSHVFQHQPENLAANFEHPVYRAGTVANDAEAEIILDGLQKVCGLSIFGIPDRAEGRRENNDVVVKQGVYDME